MITSSKNYTKQTNKQTKWTDNPRTMVKQSYTDKITQRIILTKRKRRKYIYIKEKEEESSQINKQIYQ